MARLVVFEILPLFRISLFQSHEITLWEHDHVSAELVET